METVRRRTRRVVRRRAEPGVADALVLSTAGPWPFTGAFILLAPFSREYGGALEPATPETVALAAASLVAYQAFSYWFEYVGLREYERRGPVSLLVEPGTRFWALWFVLFVGLGGLTLTENPTVLIGVLAFFKTCVDLVQLFSTLLNFNLSIIK